MLQQNFRYLAENLHNWGGWERGYLCNQIGEMKMVLKKKVLLISLVSGAMLSVSGLVRADDSAPSDFSVTLGLKVWNNEWQSWNDPGAIWTWGDTFGNATGTALNPSVTVKYKNLFVSGSIMPEKEYAVPSTFDGTTIKASRKEADFAVGYYIHPQVALTLGYKQITQSWGTLDVTWKVPAVGVSAAAGLQGTSMFMYGSFAIGKASFSSNSNLYNNGYKMEGGTYTTSEIGLGYSVTSSFRLTGGYKFQTCPTSMEAYNTTQRITLVDTTRGFVFGGSYTF